MTERSSTSATKLRTEALLVDLGASAAMLAIAIIGCKMAPNEPETRGAQSASPSPPPAAIAPVVDRSEPASGHPTTGSAVQLLARLVKLCSPDPQSATARCPKHEDEELARLFSRNKELPLEAAIAGVHEALGSSDDQLRTVAAVVAERAFAGGLGSQYPTSVRISAGQFGELAQRFNALAPAQAVQVAPLLVHEGMLAGQETRTFELLRRSREVEQTGYRHLLVYGRLPQFGRLKSHAGKDPTLPLEAAALMPDWSAAEKRTLCSWAPPFYSDSRSEVRGAAGRALAQCDIETLSNLIPIADRQGRAAEWAPGQPLAFAKACSTREQFDKNHDFCEVAQGLLQGGVTFAKLDAQTRADSLEALVSSEVWMMDLEVSQLVQRSTKSSDPVLASTARRAATRLTSIARAGLAQMMRPPGATPHLD